jgi:general nucleoside transport system permease protein
MNPDLLIYLGAAGLRLATPLMFAALGGIISERSGVINIGLEGMMVAGTFGGYLGALFFQNPWAGAAGGVLLGALLAPLF